MNHIVAATEMVPVRSNWPLWIVVHTAAADRKGVTLEEIDRWHKENGWNGVGYHVVIEDDGALRSGRAYWERGAHVRGLNSKSIGICVTGHGDLYDFNDAQYEALIPLICKLARRFNVSADHVIGHREAGTLAGAPNPGKSCPGSKVNMVDIREQTARGLEL